MPPRYKNSDIELDRFDTPIDNEASDLETINLDLPSDDEEEASNVLPTSKRPYNDADPIELPPLHCKDILLSSVCILAFLGLAVGLWWFTVGVFVKEHMRRTKDWEECFGSVPLHDTAQWCWMKKGYGGRDQRGREGGGRGGVLL